MKNILKGYKQTELGILPKEWEVVRLGEICEIKTGATPQRTIQKYWENPQINWVKTGDLNNSFILTTDEKISFVALEETSCKLLPKHTVLIAMYGGFNQIGRTGILAIEAATNQAISALIAKKLSILNHIFLNNYLIFYRKRWKQVAISSRKDPNITKTDIENFKIPLPPLKEQEKIAEILSTADTQIQNLEKLIFLKEKYKKGLMQKLFSQTIRFKGFNDKWEVVSVGEIFKITRGNVLATEQISAVQDNNNSYPVFSSKTKDGGLLGYYSEYLFENCITWTTDGANSGEVNFRKGKFYCTNVCGVLINDVGYCNQCIAEILNTKTKQYVSYVGNPKLMNNVVKRITIKIPPLQEQQKIAEILSICDDELQNLKAKLELLKKQKQALMQKLLNGKVRVK